MRVFFEGSRFATGNAGGQFLSNGETLITDLPAGLLPISVTRAPRSSWNDAPYAIRVEYVPPVSTKLRAR